MPSSDQNAQADVITFRTLGFLDAAIAHLDALRDAAHRDGISSIGARALRRFDQTLRKRAERGLIEKF